MKKIFLLVATAMCMTSCWTLIETTAPTTSTAVIPVKTVYTTQVTTPSPKVVTTTTVTVTSYDQDWSFYLDLQAVAAAFAESNSVQEFERLLNSGKYMLNNLDLNRDGWVDYLRVIETYSGYRHAFLIQACLAPSVFQDVATLVAEWRSDLLFVELIGDRYLYGYNYVVRPVFVKRPPMWNVFSRPNYAVWTSPYHYGHFPSYYQQPKPIYLNHYQAYVNTYLANHHYCHRCDYPQQPYWSGYTSLIQPHVRNDYADKHPNDAFDRRVTHYDRPATATGTIRNAEQLHALQQPTANSQQPTTRPAQSTARSTQSQISNQQSPTTNIQSRVNRSGSTRTTIKTTDTNGRTSTVQRTATSTQRNASSARSASTVERNASSSARSVSTVERSASSTQRNASSTQRSATR